MTLPDFLKVFFMAASPIVELRGAIPFAIKELDIGWQLAFLVAFAGNLLPVPFLLLFLDPLYRLLSRVRLFRTILDWIFERARRRGRIIEKYERIGLVLFVAVPLPVTGAWTGSIAASLLGLSLRRAFPSIALGVLIAGVIVTTFTLMGWTGAIIAAVSLFVLAILGLRKIW